MHAHIAPPKIEICFYGTRFLQTLNQSQKAPWRPDARLLNEKACSSGNATYAGKEYVGSALANAFPGTGGALRHYVQAICQKLLQGTSAQAKSPRTRESIEILSKMCRLSMTYTVSSVSSGASYGITLQ